MIKSIYKNKLRLKLKDLRYRLTDEGAVASVFRASASGKCHRALWYMLNKQTPDLLIELDKKGIDKFLEENSILGRSYLVFDLGFTIEKQLVDIALQEFNTFKSHEENGEQIEVIINVGKHIFKGHLDGIMSLDDDPKKEKIIVDFKSTNEYNFKYKLPKGDIGDDYIAQCNMYMHALGVKMFKFLYYNKNTSHMFEHLEKYNPIVINKIESKYDLITSKTNAPSREKLTIQKGILGYPCTYCDYKQTCLAGHYKREVDKKGKVVEIITGL